MSQRRKNKSWLIFLRSISSLGWVCDGGKSSRTGCGADSERAAGEGSLFFRAGPKNPPTPADRCEGRLFVRRRIRTVGIQAERRSLASTPARAGDEFNPSRRQPDLRAGAGEPPFHYL